MQLTVRSDSRQAKWLWMLWCCGCRQDGSWVFEFCQKRFWKLVNHAIRSPHLLISLLCRMLRAGGVGRKVVHERSCVGGRFAAPPLQFNLLAFHPYDNLQSAWQGQSNRKCEWR